MDRQDRAKRIRCKDPNPLKMDQTFILTELFQRSSRICLEKLNYPTIKEPFRYQCHFCKFTIKRFSTYWTRLHWIIKTYRQTLTVYVWDGTRTSNSVLKTCLYLNAKHKKSWWSSFCMGWRTESVLPIDWTCNLQEVTPLCQLELRVFRIMTRVKRCWVRSSWWTWQGRKDLEWRGLRDDWRRKVLTLTNHCSHCVKLSVSCHKQTRVREKKRFTYHTGTLSWHRYWNNQLEEIPIVWWLHALIRTINFCNKTYRHLHMPRRHHSSRISR